MASDQWLAEAEVRRALERLLEARNEGPVRHEMGICAGRRRVDVATLGEEIRGYEIKSGQDSLYRLPGQIRDYGRTLDRATLVTTGRHLDKAEPMLPPWWGIILALPDRNGAQLEQVREAAINPGPDPYAVAQLLWRQEAMEELKARGLARGLSKKARHYVWERLAAELELPELRQTVRQRVLERVWPGPNPPVQAEHSNAKKEK